MQTLTDTYSNMYKKTNLNEAVIDVKFEDQEKPERLRMPDVYARKVLGYAGRLSENLEERILNWVKAADWGKQAQEYLKPAIMTSLQRSYDMDDIHIVKEIINAINVLTENKESLTIFSEFINNPNNKNLLLFFDQLISEYPELKIFKNDMFLNFMINFEFSESKVAVGPGEVFVSLFSEVVNPAKGDLFIPKLHKEIELKASGGRAGKSNVVQAANKAFREIKKHIASSIDGYKDNIAEELYQLAQPFANITLAKDGANFNKIIEWILNQEYDQLFKFKYLTQISELKKMGNYGERKYGLNLEDPNLPQQITSELIKLGQLKEGGETVDFRTYFNIMPIENQLSTLRQFSPSEKNISHLIEYYYDKLSPEQIVASLQINDYQVTEDFDYILYFNNQNKNCLIIGPFDKNKYEDNLEMVLSQARNFRVEIATGGGRGGSQIYIS